MSTTTTLPVCIVTPERPTRVRVVLIDDVIVLELGLLGETTRGLSIDIGTLTNEAIALICADWSTEFQKECAARRRDLLKEAAKTVPQS
jgi:hypothetical protein